jgi:hypothetical protein
LRAQAALSTLDELGFAREAAALRRDNEMARSTAPLRLPTLDGSPHALSFATVAGPLSTLISSALQMPNAALDQRGWFEVQGLGFLHGEQVEAKAAAVALARGDKVMLPARVLVAAAALATAERSTSKERVLKGLLRSIRGVDVMETERTAQSSPLRARGKLTLRDLVKDPRAIRDAVILGAVFSPPKALNRALSKR